MVANHIKRISVPRTWPIRRKENKFVARPTVGPRPLSQTLPLVVVIRDMLKLASNAKEVKQLINAKEILVNGKLIDSYTFPIGLFDVLNLPNIQSHYRLVFDKLGRLSIIKIPQNESEFNVLRIIGKTLLKGKKLQLNLESGINILVTEKDTKQYTVGEALLIKLPKIEIIEHIPLKKGSFVCILNGKHIGRHGTISEVLENDILVVNSEETAIEVDKKSVIAIGEKSPSISVF
ncbi:MAG TPA: 30S ribosomal protein S4e [Candidatus Woesearchaeota archaeon]|nr:30S ribosomal protein S4e [Candidatus Woesearchaeota archaeon]